MTGSNSVPILFYPPVIKNLQKTVIEKRVRITH